MNEISEAGSYDCGCVVSGAKNTFTNETGLISLLTDENGEQAIRLNAPFIATEPNGTKHTFKDAITANLVNIGVKAGRNYSLYLSLSADELGNVGKLVALEGTYRKQATRPYCFSENDGWLDTNSVPYRFIVMEKDDFGNLVESEKSYAYLGELKGE